MNTFDVSAYPIDIISREERVRAAKEDIKFLFGSTADDVLLQLACVVLRVGNLGKDELVEFLSNTSEEEGRQQMWISAEDSVAVTTCYFEYAGERYAATYRHKAVYSGDMDVSDEVTHEFILSWMDEDDIQHYIDPCDGRHAAAIVEIDDALKHQDDVLCDMKLG